MLIQNTVWVQNQVWKHGMVLVLYLVCCFFKKKKIPTYHCFLLFLWTIMVALLKCFFIHCDGPCTHPKCCRPCVPQGEWDHRGAGSAETEFLFCPVWPLYLWVSVEWTRSEKRRKISETRFSQIQKPWDFLSLQILNDFKIGFVFKIKIRTRNKMLLEMSLWFTDDQALGSLQQHSVSPKEDAEI